MSAEELLDSELGEPQDGAPQSTETTTETQTVTDPNTGQPVEIESLDRYQYQGRPLKEWESGYMRQQDYTSKTQALAQERKFNDNLPVDLERVKQNPALAEQFKSIYPEKYHAYLRYVLENSGQNPQQSQQQGNPQFQQQGYGRLDPAVEMRLSQLERNIRDKEVATISAELDNKFRTLSQKYPYADEEAVVARAQTLLQKLKEQDPLNPDLRISDKHWEALWKSQHDRAFGLADSQYKKKVQSQISANQRGSETGQGGGLPGQAPRQFKTIKEASAAFLQDIESGAV